MRNLLTLVGAALFVACTGGSGGTGGYTFLDGGDLSDGGSQGDGSRKNDGGTNGECRSNSDCGPSFMMCVAPGQGLCGGPAPRHECDVDQDCADGGANRICLAQGCGSLLCWPKCTKDPDCGSEETCSLGTGHCVPKVCSATSCAINFVCPADPTQGCARKTCTSDRECSGACVNGGCWSGAGTCMSPPP